MNPESATQIFDRPTPEMLGNLEQHVQRQLNGRVRAFRLSMRDDGLILEGHTKTYYTKQLAQHAVMRVIDLPIRANDIEVT